MAQVVAPSQPAVLPRLPASLIRAFLPVAERDEVLEDLAREFRLRERRDGSLSARSWLWRQALGSLPSLLSRTWWRGRTGFEPQANAFSSGGPPVEQWIMDARFSLRRLVRRPLYAALAIGTLALGVGGTAAIFGIARAVLFNPLPYREADGIGLFWMNLSWTQQEFAFLRNNTPGFSEISQYRQHAVTLERGNAPASLVPSVAASHELFSVLGTQPMLGRTFETGDDVQGAEPVAVVSYGLWHDLGGDPSILGTRVRLDGKAYTVIGVMPRGFWFPSPAERVWMAQPLDPEERSGNYSLVGRVSPGTTVSQLGGPLAALTKLLGERFTYPPQWDKTRNAVIQSAEEASIKPLRPAIVATLVAMAMILLIACANVAALMLAQVEGRTVELAVRSAMGADRKRLTRQLLSESLLMGAAAGLAGAVVAVGSFKLLVKALPLGAWAETAALDWRVFFLAMVFALVAALLISLAPVLALWRGRLSESLVSGRTAGVKGRGVRLESALVIAEVALAVLMAAGAGVLGRSVAKLYAIDPGFKPQGVGLVDFVLPSDLADAERKRLLGDVLDRVRQVPGVQYAGLTQFPPLRAPAWNTGINIEGKAVERGVTTLVRVVSPGYLEALGVTVQGRQFEATDLLNDPTAGAQSGAIIVNQALARKFFESENPLGRGVDHGFGSGYLQVVGVAGDVAEGFLTADPAPVRYIPYSLLPFTSASQSVAFKVSGKQDLIPFLNAVRRQIVAASPRIAIAQSTTMDMEVARAVGPVRQVMTLVSLLTGLALLLGAIGVYGVMSHFVLRRKRDWGIRIALGLAPGQVVSSVVGRGFSLVAAGVGCGLVGFLFLGRLLRPLIYGIGASDPAAIAIAATALMIVGVVAALVPAARAGRTDPAVVFRDQ